MKINFVKTHPDAVIPTRGSAGAAGFDLTAVSLKRAADLYIYDTGLALEIPSGYWGGIYARSSIFFTGLEKCGGVCVIDSDYRGSILVMFREVPGDQHARRLALHPLFPGKTGLMHPYKPGDGTTVVRCKACGAIWTTRAKFVEAMPYDIGPVTLPRDAFQHTRAIVALTMLDALLYQFRPLVEDQPKVLRHLDEMREIIEACGNPIRKRRTSAGAQRDLHAACDAMYESYRFPSDPSEKVDRWAALFCAADLMICGAAGMCPNYTSTPDWWKLRRLSDKWVTGLMEMCPGCDEEGDKIYEELMA